MSLFGPNPRFHDISHEDTGHDEIDVTGLSGLLADGQTPVVHAADHQNGGGDEVSVAALSGLLADQQTPRVHSTGHENGGADEISVAGLSGLLGDDQKPVVHAENHELGFFDEISVAGLVGARGSYARLQEEQTSGTHGGTFTTGAWRTRILNTESDPDGIVTLAGNAFTLQAGTYRVQISAPAYAVAAHKARLYNVTDASSEIDGTSELSAPTYPSTQRSVIVGIFTLAAPKVLRIEHYCGTTRATDGLGPATSYGADEVYTVVEIWKLP